MEITVTVKDGANAEAIARCLRFHANLIEGIDPKKAASNDLTQSPLKKKGKPKDEVEETEDEETEDEAEETDEVEESDDDEETEESEDEETSDDEETDEDEEPPKKAKGKTKGPTLKDVNAALKARAEKTSFAKAKLWLKKKFKVESINDVKPADYVKLIKLSKADV